MNMSRFNLSVKLSVGLVLASGISLASAQATGPETGVMTRNNSIASVNEQTLMDANLIAVNDPHEVDILFKEGAPIVSILQGLNEKGFHIEYREKQFLPTMTLLNLPQSTEIDDVLTEILEPWNFRIFRTPFGKVVVTPVKNPTHKKVAITMQDAAQEK